MALIELERVSRQYDAGGTPVRALDDVSLRIEAGEMVAIVGASGSGKSTLMNLLGCLDKPDGGSLRVDGRDLAALSPDAMAVLRRDTFGFIFQRYHLLPHLDAVGNVELPAMYAGHGRRARRARAIALLRRLGLGERLGHKPGALSGGQQQRVSIARALMNGGRIILADEPTGALDSASGAELLALLDELHAQGHTVILVTHDAQVAARAQRIVEMRDGRIVRDERVRDRPAALPAQPTFPPSSGEPAGHERAGAAGRFGPWREALATSAAALNGSRMRSLLSMLGISIGIAAVVTIASLGEAARRQVERSAQEASASTLTISRGNRTLPSGTATQPLRLQDVAALRALPGVRNVVPRHASTVAARQGRYDDSVLANGIASGELSLAGQVVREGRDIGAHDLDARAQVAVLDRAARNFLFAPGEPVLGRQVMLGALPFTVVGVSQPAYAGDAPFLPNFKAVGNVYVPQTTYSAKLDTRQEADMLTVHFESPLPLASFRAQVRQRLLALHGGVEDFSLESNDMIGSIFTGLLGQMTGVLTAIAAISLVVGGVGVMNIMLVSVSERTREIGIRMAVGARRRDVRRQFLVESVLLCCLGGLGGLALPWLASQAAGLGLPGLTIDISWEILGLALGTCTAIGLVFGNLPAHSAARLDPVVALARD